MLRLRFKPSIALPSFFALANALFWFFPYRDRIPGWGDDPSFNLWVHERNWQALSEQGVLSFLGARFWDAKIFYPFPLSLALSDNDICSALLSWPIKLLTGSGPFALNFLAFFMSLAAFFFMAKWLESLGIKKFAWWGGLLFSACGWLQTQLAHYQNIPIFLFPLALWSWNLFVKDPRGWRILGAASAFAWIIGWNLYYQTFANILLCFLILHQGWSWHKELPAKEARPYYAKLGALLLLTILFELPIALRYFQTESILGTISVGLGEFRMYSAGWLSFFSQTQNQSLLQTWLPFYPSPALNIEAAGFMGLTWLALIVLAIREKKSRPFLIVSLLTFWIALGPDYGLFHFLMPFPGFSSLRAIGRLQLLTLLFSIPAVLFLFERKSKPLSPWLLALVLLELTPGVLPAKSLMPSNLLTQQKTEFEQKLESLSNGTKVKSLLLYPTLENKDQLSLVRTHTSLLQGYSGRTPLPAGLLSRKINETLSSSGSLTALLDFAQPALVAARSSQLSAQLFELTKIGCYRHLEEPLCLFERPLHTPKLPLIQLSHTQADTEWTTEQDARSHLAVLRTTKTGILDYAELATCKLKEFLKFPFLPEIKTYTRLNEWSFSDVVLEKGSILFEIRSSQAIFRLPPPLRPTKRYEIHCQQKRDSN